MTVLFVVWPMLIKSSSQRLCVAWFTGVSVVLQEQLTFCLALWLNRGGPVNRPAMSCFSQLFSLQMHSISLSLSLHSFLLADAQLHIEFHQL